MIFTSVILIVLAIAGAVMSPLAMLPDVTVDSFASGGFSSLVPTLGLLDHIIGVYELMYGFGIFLLIVYYVLVFRLLIFLIKKIPFIK